MASVQRRAEYLPQVLTSLLPQVDKLAFFLNGYEKTPDCIADLERSGRATVDRSPENLGAEKKMHWAGDWSGIYCTVDDDTIYPPNYVETMVAAVERWNGCALVSGHGRSFRPKATSVHDLMPGSVGLFYARIDSGRWVNHAGTGVMAWDARKIKMPTEWPERNMADMQVALWAQRSAVPIWLIAHQAHWIKSLAPLDPKGIWRTSQAEGHRRRNEAVRRQSRERGWKIHRAGPE